MKLTTYSDLAAMRAELMRDYEPANAQERLLVMEVAAAWQRLDHCRQREQIFFDIQRHAQSVETGLPKENFGEGSEVLMWVEKPQRAYDQILAAIREAHVMFDRAIRRIEDVKERRLKRERQERQQEQAVQRTRQKHDRQSFRQTLTGSIVELPVKGAPEEHRILKT